MTSDSGQMRSNRRPEWLPSGWITKAKETVVGRKYKCYIDPKSGRKFYSKLEIERYLKTVDNGKASEKMSDKSSSEATKVGQNLSEKKKESIRKFDNKKVISSTPADGLPSGWIKEVRTRKSSVRKKKDPYYIDPSSGYVFFSKLDALRYLETGGIETCAMKPMKRDIIENENETKPPEATTMKQLFEGDILHETKTPENKIPKRPDQVNKSKASPATSPGLSTKRLKQLEPKTKTDPLSTEPSVQAQTDAPPERAKTEANGQDKRLDKEKPSNDEKTQPEVSKWTDPGLDFEVKTLTDEMPFETPLIAASLQQESVARTAMP